MRMTTPQAVERVGDRDRERPVPKVMGALTVPSADTALCWGSAVAAMHAGCRLSASVPVTWPRGETSKVASWIADAARPGLVEKAVTVVEPQAAMTRLLPLAVVASAAEEAPERL